MLRSNIAACHLKLEDWKSAVEVASKALDGLDKLQGKGKEAGAVVNGEEKQEDEEEADEEIVSEGATKAEDVSVKGKREADIERIRAKALMRRAKGRSEMGGWSSLQGAEEGNLFPFTLVSYEISLIISRLQNTLQDEQPFIGRYEDSTTAITTTTSTNKSCSGKGDSRNDG